LLKEFSISTLTARSLYGTMIESFSFLCRRAKKAASTKRFCRVRLPIPLHRGVIGRALAADGACLLPVGIEVVCNAITRLATHSRVKSPIRIDNTAGRRSFAAGSSGLVNDNHANG
jgi:hypothetical protein